METTHLPRRSFPVLGLAGRLLPLVLGLAGAGCAADDAVNASTSADVTATSPGATLSEFGTSTLGTVQQLHVTIVKDRVGAPVLDDAGNATLYASYVDRGATIIARSTNSGVTWSELSRLDGRSKGGAIFVAPTRSNVLYLTNPEGYSWGYGELPDSGGYLLRSADAGRTWHEVSTGPVMPAGGGRGFDVIDINPGDDGLAASEDHLLGANCAGVSKSLDGGRSWSLIPNTALASGDCNGASLTRGIDDRKTIYVLFDTGEGGGSSLARTTDDGVSWQQAALDVRGGEGYLVGARHLVVDPKDAKHVYLTDMNGFYSSADRGDTFFSHTRGLPRHDGSAYPNVLSRVAVDTVSAPPAGATSTLFIQNNDAIFRWAPANEPEGGHWARVGAVPGATHGTPLVIGSKKSPRLLSLAETWNDDGIAPTDVRLAYATIRP